MEEVQKGSIKLPEMSAAAVAADGVGRSLAVVEVSLRLV
jgi:hypothetical protein